MWERIKPPKSISLGMPMIKTLKNVLFNVKTVITIKFTVSFGQLLNNNDNIIQYHNL